MGWCLPPGNSVPCPLRLDQSQRWTHHHIWRLWWGRSSNDDHPGSSAAWRRGPGWWCHPDGSEFSETCRDGALLQVLVIRFLSHSAVGPGPHCGTAESTACVARVAALSVRRRPVLPDLSAPLPRPTARVLGHTGARPAASWQRISLSGSTRLPRYCTSFRVLLGASLLLFYMHLHGSFSNAGRQTDRQRILLLNVQTSYYSLDPF